MTGFFRDFLYLDERTINSYLSSVEGGVYDEEDRHITVDGPGSTPEGEKAPAGTMATSDSRRKVLRQTAAAKFARLYHHISDSEQVHKVRSGEPLTGFVPADDDFCEIKGTVEIPQIVSAVMNAEKYQAIGNMVKIFEGLGFSTNVAHTEAMGQLEALAQAREAIGDKVSVLLNVATGFPRVVLPVRTDVIGDRFDELEGRVTVFGRVAEVRPRGSAYSLIQIPGQAGMSRQQRRKMERDRGANTEGIVKGPLIVLHILAVYR
ncbi:DUF6414 family protein [Actinokineospora cianjurensis]|uniref:Uncharacterized protein n=1 Tax=Actinokineospora cianjurensis TaxID=585224 RepID=A0A421B8P1_9PSEU|nr:hypothetical protein [Actinokineospora cianjurensis]RLK60892.1 hypothetical protein CLV68_1406 [Actinokineospora cianjurensis]